MTIRLCSVPQLDHFQHEPVWRLIRSLVPGTNLTVIDYKSCISKHMLHMTVALTMFMMMTLHQSVLLQALMVEICFTAQNAFFLQLHTPGKSERFTLILLPRPFEYLCLALLLKRTGAKRPARKQFDSGDSEQEAHACVSV